MHVYIAIIRDRVCGTFIGRVSQSIERPQAACEEAAKAHATHWKLTEEAYDRSEVGGDTVYSVRVGEEFRAWVERHEVTP